MQKAENNVCPRCGGGVPSDERRGEYMGALSRVADVEICSMCGMDEAVAFLVTAGRENGLVPVEQWPIERDTVINRTAPFYFGQQANRSK